jgi:uncharacterized DUF497 family protein
LDSQRIDITWDPAKAESNWSKHGVSFAEAAEVLLDPLALTVFDPAHSATEDRWFTLGATQRGRLLAVAHTHRDEPVGMATVRIVTAREATRNERHQYESEPR